MENYQKDFGPFDGKIWLNSASEGAVPRVAVDALKEAAEWKLKPYLLTNRKFREVPRRLKITISRLFNVAEEDVILGNSATYGIHLLANGIDFSAGEEVVLMANDFPSDILPWLALSQQGVVVKQIVPKSFVVQPEEIKEHLTPKTKVVCLPHVHTFSGHIVDIEAIGHMCQKQNIIFIVNCSQSAGNIPLNLTKLPIDAMTTAAFKWLCGPYGTGFCWMKSKLRESLKYNQAYWCNVMTDDDWVSLENFRLEDRTDAKKYDVFGTANFFNFYPLNASLEYLLEVGIDRIHAHNDQLVEMFTQGLNEERFNVLSPIEKEKRSSLLVFSHKDSSQNQIIFEKLLQRGVYLANWKGLLRAAPHLYNTKADIEHTLTTLNSIENEYAA